MTHEQIIVFSVIIILLGLFIWNKWRYDIIALMALLVFIFTGIVPAERAFDGFGHPAVITVAAVLLISRGLMNAGVIDVMAVKIVNISDKEWIQVAVLCGLCTLCGAFMNNVGSLALFMPIGIWMAHQNGRSPSYILMPIAFASLLGGLLTLIATPPNMIVSSYRETVMGEPFKMFDYTAVGGTVALAGIAYLALIGWRLTPRARKGGSSQKDLFEISSYLTEMIIPDNPKFSGTLKDLSEELSDIDFTLTAIVRNKKKNNMPRSHTILRSGDILLIDTDADSIKKIMDSTGFELSAAEELKESENFDKSSLMLMEAVVLPSSMLVDKSANRLELRDNYNVNILGIAREGRRLRARVDSVKISGGDILLIQVNESSMQEDMERLGCLPLAKRRLNIGRPRKVITAAALFVLTIVLIATGVLTAAVGMVSCALMMVLIGLIRPREIYESINLPVIVLLAAMIPVGMALETSGGSQIVADLLLNMGDSMPPAAVLTIFMVTLMVLSDILNNSATAVLACPIAISLAQGLNTSPDTFLMGVAIVSSGAFLTPIGHQSNTLVMVPGGYKFGDYWKVGLPLMIVVLAVSIPMLLIVWPF